MTLRTIALFAAGWAIGSFAIAYAWAAAVHRRECGCGRAWWRPWVSR